jgi:hypothetical protein
VSNETTFPAGPFYIQSKINLSNWALTTDGTNLKLSPLVGGIEHLWAATPDNRGGASLKHIQTGKILTATTTRLPSPFPPIEIPTGLAVAPLDPANGLQLFRAEDLGDNWRGINLLANWELKINVSNSDVHGKIAPYHWDGGAPNEEWRLIAETSTVTTESVEYDLKGATSNLNLPPMVSDQSDQDNKTSSGSLTGSINLTQSTTTSRSITNSTSDTTGRVYTQTFGAKGGIDKVFEISGSASFSESSSKTIAYSDTTVNSKTDSHSIVVNINVPPGKKYRYSILVFNGQCSIPYTAHMLFQSVVPGAVPYRFVSTGVYTGVNAIRSEVSSSDITPGPAKAILVEQHPIPIQEPILVSAGE